jgi:bifunctional DNA-binding transcriptional regulator/antitoxin component of YhaV-PrlF toxin-antitoxin module
MDDGHWPCESAALDKPFAALQHCGMTALQVSKRGTVTLPPEIRQALGLNLAEHPMMLAELRNGGLFLQPAEALPVRDIPLETMQAWIAEDERDAEGFWQRAGKA